jgi:hypothetical protein
MTRCYDSCDCRCGQTYHKYDDVVAAEAPFAPSLATLATTNIGWQIEDDYLDWNVRGAFGVYLFWEKDDYCDQHHLYHMSALYVGKGGIDRRFRHHWQTKSLTEHGLNYFTFVEMRNRQAKYVEQLLLDLFDFPFNRAENPGSAKLCWHLTQSQVD